MKRAEARHNPPRIDVGRSLLEWAMNRSNKSVHELSKKQPLRGLSEWLAGTRKPTRGQLEAFATATYTPFGYLLLSEPPRERPSTIPHFRTIGDSGPATRSINLEDMIKIVEERQEWIRDYLVDLGAEPLKFVGSGSVGDDPIRLADTIRKTLGLSRDWTLSCNGWEDAQRRLVTKMEDARIFVSKSSVVQHNTRRPLNLEEFRGFVLVGDYAPFVFVNGADIYGGQMFTLAHELAHVWMGKSASFDLRGLAANAVSKLERACNKAAAEFLAPAAEMCQYWAQFVKDPRGPYKAASDHFKISHIVAARRALDAQCISRVEFEEFYHKYRLKQDAKKRREQDARKDLDKKGGPAFSAVALPRIGNRFFQTVITAVGERNLLYTDAYYLTGLRPKMFDEVQARIQDGES